MGDNVVTPEVSVLVSMYNAETSIERALRSVIDQSYTDWELVVVDDASTDDSLQVAAATISGLPQNKARIVHLDTNSGVSAARNAALSNARGRWLTFLDADDEFTPNRLTEMMDAVDARTDIVICRHTLVQVDGSRRERGPSVLGRASGRTSMVTLLNDRLTPYLWDKLFRHSIVRGTRFPEGIHRAEDGLFCLAAMSQAREVVSLKTVGYHYYVSAGSLTWGRVSSISESRSLMDHMAKALSGFRDDREVQRGLTVSHVLTFLNTANQAIQVLSGDQRNAFVREAQAQITWRQILVTMRGRPDFGVAAAVLKVSPRFYGAAYRRYVERLYSLKAEASAS